VREGISSQVTQQVRETVIPLITRKLRGIDDQLNDHVMPKVEEGIEKVMKGVIERIADQRSQGGDGNDVTPAVLQ